MHAPALSGREALAAMVEGLALAAAGRPAEGRAQAEAARTAVVAAPARRAWARWGAARLASER